MKWTCTKCGTVTREHPDGECCAGGTWWADLEAGPGRCQEASPFSGEKYIPCNAPATVLIDWAPRTERAVRMCPMCADHNVRNRSGRVVRELTEEERQPARRHVCRVCKTHLGYGVRSMHLGLCEKPACRHEAAKKKEEKPDDRRQRPA